MNFSRRGFGRSVLAALGASGLLGARGRVYALAGATENAGAVAEGYRFFNLGQIQTLEAICDQIVPPDDYPGAKDAGAVQYIDRALSGWLVRNRWDYVAGLQGVDESSELMFGAPFTNLSWDQQTKVLEAMELGEAPGRSWQKLQIGQPGAKSSQSFFNLLVTHTMQGYYGDPSYGGNRHQGSWKMLGFLQDAG